jgi:hypothetical protein
VKFNGDLKKIDKVLDKIPEMNEIKWEATISFQPFISKI